MVDYIGLMCLLMLDFSNHYTCYNMIVYNGLMCLLMLNISNHYTYYGRLHQFDVFVDARFF